VSFFRRAGAAIARIFSSAADPAAEAGKVLLYAKDVAGVIQLFSRASDGTISQLTPISSSAGVKGVYGDGSDGSFTLDGTAPPANSPFTLTGSVYVLDRNAHFVNLTIAAGFTLDNNHNQVTTTDAFVLRCKGTLTINVGGTIRRNGVNSTASTGGAASSPAGTIDGSGAGANSTATNGNNAAAVAFVPFGYTTVGGNGGDTVTNTGGSGGASTVQSDGASVRDVVSISTMTYFASGIPGIDQVRSGPGGGGGAGTGGLVGTGGGGGGPPNCILANILVNNGVIEGKGGNAANATNLNTAGGGGGGGGLLCIVTESYTGTGTIDLSGGTGGVGNGTGSSGVAGGAGLLIGPIPG
jgi:hypothetical protein